MVSVHGLLESLLPLLIMSALLEIDDLQIEIRSTLGPVPLLDGVSLRLGEGETLGLVGESGCGKTMLALSILRLLPPVARVVGGSIRVAGTELGGLGEKEMRSWRGRHIAMIFQEPMSALNPLLTIGLQISEVLATHLAMDRRSARARSLELLKIVEMPAAEQRIDSYPHELSGGMRQRAMIAMALACEPRLLLADEATTALDVTVQAQILDLIADLQKRFRMGVLLVTHDLALLAERAERMAVMYAGRIVENASTEALLRNPRHPYTRGLLRSVPRMSALATGEPLHIIPGRVPDLDELPAGCRFFDRCERAESRCESEAPRLIEQPHPVACWNPE